MHYSMCMRLLTKMEVQGCVCSYNTGVFSLSFSCYDVLV